MQTFVLYSPPDLTNLMGSGVQLIDLGAKWSKPTSKISNLKESSSHSTSSHGKAP